MITLLEKEGSWLKFSYDSDLNLPLLHVSISKWSLSKYKEYLYLLGNVLTLLKNNGINEVYSIVKTDKNQKFNELFGFTPCYKGFEKDTQNPLIIMRLVC